MCNSALGSKERKERGGGGLSSDSGASATVQKHASNFCIQIYGTSTFLWTKRHNMKQWTGAKFWGNVRSKRNAPLSYSHSFLFSVSSALRVHSYVRLQKLLTISRRLDYPFDYPFGANADGRIPILCVYACFTKSTVPSSNRVFPWYTKLIILAFLYNF